jgi:hypothetical protein
MCEVHVIEGDVKDAPMPLTKRDAWKIEKDLQRVREEIHELTDAKSHRHDEKTKAEILTALRLREGNLERELAGLPPESSEEKAKRLKSAKAPPAVEPDALVPLTPERKKELQDAFHNAAEAEKNQAASP